MVWRHSGGRGATGDGVGGDVLLAPRTPRGAREPRAQPSPLKGGAVGGGGRALVERDPVGDVGGGAAAAPGDCHRPIARSPQVPYHSSNTPTRGVPSPTDTPHPPVDSREGGNSSGWGAALRSPSPTPRHPATLPPHGRRASDPRTTGGWACWSAYQVGILGSVNRCASSLEPPSMAGATPAAIWRTEYPLASVAAISHRPMVTCVYSFPMTTPYSGVALRPASLENPGWGAALRSPSPTPRHPATLPPHGRRASDPRKRESRVAAGLRSPHKAVAQRPA